MSSTIRSSLTLAIMTALALTTSATAGELLDAARNANASRATELIMEGASVTEAGRQGDTALHWAAFNGQIELASLLMDRGAKVNARVNNGNTPLHQAAYAGRLEMVALLLDEGADLDLRNEQGLTPVQWAARNDHEHVVDFLLSRGAKLEQGEKLKIATGAPRKRVSTSRLRGMTQHLGELPSLVLRVPDMPTAGPVRLTPNQRLSGRKLAPRPSPPTRSDSASSAAWLQLGSFRSEAEARSHWQSLTRRLQDVLADLEPVIRSAQVKNRGEYQRLRVGPLSKDKAEQLCEQIRQSRRDCLVVMKYKKD